MINWLFNKKIKFRQELTLGQIYDLYFKDFNLPKENFTYLWHEIASSLNVPVMKLRPGDNLWPRKRFFPMSWTEWNVEDLLFKMMSQYHCENDLIDVESLSTVDDFIKFFGSKKKSNSEFSNYVDNLKGQNKYESP